MKELQKQIIEEMHVQKEINPAEEIRRSVDFLKSYMNKYPFTFVCTRYFRRPRFYVNWKAGAASG